MAEEKKAVPVYLGDELRKRLRIAAATHDQTMTAIAVRGIEAELDRMDGSELTAQDICPFMEAGVPEAWPVEAEGEK